MQSLRIVIVTFPGKRGIGVLQALATRGIPVAAVILDKGRLNQRDKMTRARHILHHGGPAETARRIISRIRRGLRRSPSELDAYRNLVPVIHKVDDANNEVSIGIMADWAPDLIVLGSSRVLRRPVISIPRIGILNAHPGLLPEYRGVDVIAWAVHNGDPLGCTVHFVDAGVDTGAIVAQRRFEPRPGDTLSSLARRGHMLGHELMADAVAQLIATNKVETLEQRRAEGKQYYRMPPSLRATTEAMLNERVSESVKSESAVINECREVKST